MRNFSPAASPAQPSGRFQRLYNEPQGITAARVAKKTGLSRAAVRRFLLTLETLGYAENTQGV